MKIIMIANQKGGTGKTTTALNPELELIGVLVCQFDSRLNLHNAALTDLKASGLPIFKTTISRGVKVSSSVGTGRAAQGKQSEQYNQLSKEVIKWLKKQK